MSYQQRAVHLYRHSLKQLHSWSVRREIFYEEAAKLREAFEANRNITEARHIRGVITRGEEELWKQTHPDPYIVPYYVGGSLYARNPPFPPMTQYTDFGREGFH